MGFVISGLILVIAYLIYKNFGDDSVGFFVAVCIAMSGLLVLIFTVLEALSGN